MAKILMYSIMYKEWVEVDEVEKLGDNESIIEYHDNRTGLDKIVIINTNDVLVLPVGESTSKYSRYKDGIKKEFVECDCGCSSCTGGEYQYTSKMMSSINGGYIKADALDYIAKLEFEISELKRGGAK